MSKEKFIIFNVKIEEAQEKLEVFIETSRLVIRSIKEDDFNDHKNLLADPTTMEKYASGVPMTNENQIRTGFNRMLERWKEKDPFSRYSVFLKETKEYIGRITLGHGDRAGQSEIEYILNQKFWNNGLGTEAISSIVLHLVPKLVERNFLLENRPLDSIVASTREDNPGSWKILEKIGFEGKGMVENFGASRRSYFCDVNHLCLGVYYRNTFQCIPPKFSDYTFFRTEVCGCSEQDDIQKKWDEVLGL